MFCIKCGRKLADDSAFCEGCGAPVETVQPAPAAQPQPQPQVQPVAAQPVIPQQQPAYAAPAAAPAAPAAAPRAPKSKKTLGIAAVAVVVIAAIGIGAYMMLAPTKIDAKLFPDLALRQYVMTFVDTNHDGALSREEAGAVLALNLSDATTNGASVTDLTGIERFTALESLDGSNSLVVAADLSKNTALTFVNLNNERLQSVDVSGCSKLQTLWIPSSATAKGVPSSLKENNLLTKVSYSSGSSQTYSYNNEGRLTSSRFSSSSSSTTTDYSYDDKGDCTKTDSGGYSTVYEYDEAHRITKEVFSYSSSTSTYQFSYDADGNLVSRSYDTSGSYSSSSKADYAYANGKLTSAEVDSSYYNGSNKFAFTLDEKGRYVGVTGSYGNSGDTWSYTYSYDDRDRMVSLQHEYSNSSYTTNHQFSDDGLTEITTSSSNTYRLETTYDAEGRIVAGVNSYDGKVNAKLAFTYFKGKLPASSTYEYYSKGSLSSTTTTNYSYVTLYSTHDYQSALEDYDNKYPFEYYGNGSDGFDYPVSRFAGNYAAAVSGTLLPREARMSMFYN